MILLAAIILALLTVMLHTQRKIMSKISDTNAAVQAAFTQMNTAVAGITGDIQSLKDQIAAFQNSNGTLSSEDIAALAEMKNTAQAAADKLSALDALTPAAGTGESEGNTPEPL